MKNRLIGLGMVIGLFAVAATIMAHPQAVSVSPSGGPRGQQGIQGIQGVQGNAGTNATNPSFTFPTPTQVGVGGTPTLGITGTYPNLALQFGLVTGATGAAGAAGVNSFGTPNARTVAFGTAYQATDITKPAIVTVLYSCALTAALLSPGSSTLELRYGPTNAVASGGGNMADTYSQSLSVSIVLSLGWNGAGKLWAALPTGWYFAARQTVGTGCSISAAADQAVG